MKAKIPNVERGWSFFEVACGARCCSCWDIAACCHLFQYFALCILVLFWATNARVRNYHLLHMNFLSKEQHKVKNTLSQINSSSGIRISELHWDIIIHPTGVMSWVVFVDVSFIINHQFICGSSQRNVTTAVLKKKKKLKKILVAWKHTQGPVFNSSIIW